MDRESIVSSFMAIALLELYPDYSDRSPSGQLTVLREIQRWVEKEIEEAKEMEKMIKKQTKSYT